jgi:hypothetical protein
MTRRFNQIRGGQTWREQGLDFFGETRLVGEERTPPVAVTFPDSRLGGNQYITSTSTGAWEDLLLYEMLPAIEQRLGAEGVKGPKR